MKRRDLLAASGALALTGCAAEPTGDAVSNDNRRFQWKMVTTWPPNFPGMQTGVMRMVQQLERASAGRLQIRVYASGELVPGMEVFDTVSRGVTEMGHGAAYYWKGKFEAAQFFTAIPFGMTAMEMNAWLYYGGGLALYREFYDAFNLVPFPAGNTGVQMGGWFNREINTVADLRGLKMRIPGIGGEALARAGGAPVALLADEIYTSLATGVIDAAEWVGPFNDLSMGLHEAARYYYYPGWQEPGPTLELLVNKQAFALLPPDLQQIVELAAAALNDQMTAEFTARNAGYLAELVRYPKVELRRFPDEVLEQLRRYTDELLVELVAKDPRVARVYESFNAFRQQVKPWSEISELAYLQTRQL